MKRKVKLPKKECCRKNDFVFCQSCFTWIHKSDLVHTCHNYTERRVREEFEKLSPSRSVARRLEVQTRDIIKTVLTNVLFDLWSRYTDCQNVYRDFV